MSTYYWAHACLNFDTKELLEEAVKPLRDGGWLDDDNTMMGDGGEVKVNDGNAVINGTTFNLLPELYINIYDHLIDLVNKAKSGFFNISCDDGDLYFDVWNNGRWIHVESYKEIANFLLTQKEKDYFLIEDEDDFMAKYDDVDDSFYEEERSDVFIGSFTNAIDCFQDEKVALKFFKDKMFVKSIHSEARASCC